VADTNSNTPNEVKFSTFMIGSAILGIDILKIQEINKQFEITKVPQAENYIRGILNLRGKIVTIIDLGQKLGLEPVKKHKDNRNLIIESDGEYIGLLVDRIGDVVNANLENLDPPPSNVGGINKKFFKGVLKTEANLVGVLDTDAVLS
jgi:purine-binding chemotaxis protein CheW